MSEQATLHSTVTAKREQGSQGSRQEAALLYHTSGQERIWKALTRRSSLSRALEKQRSWASICQALGEARVEVLR